jgi:GH15 family glucan-1,4-alpha-glucosidase
MSKQAPSDAPGEPHSFSARQRADYKPIADYGVIGDMHSAALIAADGSIDWACLPYFDSPAVFLRLLDCDKGGYCAVRVAGLVKTSRCYLDGTNILQTTFTAGSGTLVVSDFMPLRPASDAGQQAGRIIRAFRCTSGSVDLSIDIKPTFAFASEQSQIHSRAPGVVVFEGRNVRLLVEAPGIEVHEDGTARSAFRLKAGDTKFVTTACTGSRAPLEVMDPGYPPMAFKETQRYWTDWSIRFDYQGDYRDEILRSILTLKLLTFAPTGAIVAAPTSSLPEVIGGGRNWDYRLSWIRDSQFVLKAFMHCGYFEEAHRFFQFLKKAANGPVDQLQILYDIRGERAGRETELRHLQGYRHSHPVRVGNAASRQKQSDIYGELLNCMYVYCNMAASEAEKKARAHELWPMAQSLADYVVRHWCEPDHGIWESRETPRQYVHSKAMCWTALDRAIRLASDLNASSGVKCWRQERNTILESIRAHGFDKTLGAFVQSYGSEVLDASVLRLPLQGVIDADDPRMRSTVEQIERRLLEDGLLYRYTDAQGEPGEGAFTSCTLWLINYYVLIGREQRARHLLDHLLSFQNELGLFSEEINPRSREQLGNFPQALTHAALISAIRHLEGGPHRESHRR